MNADRGYNTGKEAGVGVTAIVQKLLARLPQTTILLLSTFKRGEEPAPEHVELA